MGAAPLKLTLGGGTNAEAAPQIDFLLQVFQPMAAKFGINFKLDVKMRYELLSSQINAH